MTVSENVSLHYGRDFQKQQWIFVSFLDNLIWNTFYQNNCDYLRASQHVLRAKAHGGVLQYITWKGTAWIQQSLLKISVMGCCSGMFSSMTFLSCRGNLEQKKSPLIKTCSFIMPCFTWQGLVFITVSMTTLTAFVFLMQLPKNKTWFCK